MYPTGFNFMKPAILNSEEARFLESIKDNVEQYAQQYAQQCVQQYAMKLQMDTQNRANQHIGDICRDAYLKELIQYDQIYFFVDQTRHMPMIVLENSMHHNVVKPLSNCTDFSVHYGFDPVSEQRTICLSFNTGNMDRREVIILENDYRPEKLYNGFLAQGGNICYGKQTSICANLFFRFVSNLLEQVSTRIMIPGWSKTNGCWFINQCENELWNTPLLYRSALEQNGQTIFALARVYGILKGRLPQTISLSRPFCLVGTTCSNITISLNDIPKDFSRGIKSQKYVPWVFVAPETVSNYRSLMNIGQLISEVSCGSSTVYFICSRTLTPLQRDHCLIIEIDALPSGEPFQNVSLSNFVTQIENNPDAFDNMIGKAYEEASNAIEEDCIVRADLIALTVVAAAIKWYFTITIPTAKATDAVVKQFESCLKQALIQWEALNTPDLLLHFRNAIFEAKRTGKLHIEPLKGAAKCTNIENVMFYDDCFYYVSTKLLKRIVSEYLSGFTSSCVFLGLEEMGILGKPTRKYIKTVEGQCRELRFRTLNRASLRQLGQRELILG